jgi:LysR family transcriptional regulator, glycine cleavage system transcriptional activator
MARRFHLPPLDLIQGFEAAARNLSFTKAAEELLLTQSAISRQIRGLEEHLGVPLFQRRARAIALTEQGQVLNRAVSDLLERLQQVTDALRADAGQPHLTVTTTSGFASLWLIPRLRRFTQLNPDVDVRISATYKTVNLERGLVDVAVRYCRSDAAPEGAKLLFGEELFPVCSPLLRSEGERPLRTPEDLRHHALLRIDDASGFLDWGTWLEAQGLSDFKPAASLRFDNYEQMIAAALAAQGVAMGISSLVSRLLESGQLIQPFSKSVIGTRAYYVISSAATGQRPHVRAFVDWLVAEAAAAAPARAEPPLTSPAPVLPSTAAAPRARSRP